MSKPREFWINIYDNEHRVYDCVAHTSLEMCRAEAASHVFIMFDRLSR